MKFSNQGRSNLKKIGVFACCLGFLAIGLLPDRAQATPVTAGATASLNWGDAHLTGFNSLNWIYPADQDSDTRNSFSSAYVALNGAETDPGASDAFEGPFTTTAAVAKLKDATGKVTGTASTDPDGKIKASSNISLDAGPSNADVFITEASFTGQFTVDHSVTLKLKVPYTITLSADSGPGISAYADALIGIYLFNFDTAESLASSELWLNTLTDGSSDFNRGFLSLTWCLIPEVVYDFEASASTLASASASGPAQEPVPEPATLFLLGSGLVGLIAFRKKIK